MTGREVEIKKKEKKSFGKVESAFLKDNTDELIEFDKVYSSGRFSRWSASLRLCVKF